MSQTMLRVTAILFLMNIAVIAAAQNGAPKVGVGASAPELALEKLLQAPKDAKADWQSLHGKVVVLDFWATWCAPCVASMPHLNSLVDQFKDRQVQLITITDQDESAIADFLRRRKINAWVGLDTDRSVFKAYGVEGIPYTVVISQEGKIAATTTPKNLTAEILEGVLAGKQITKAEEPATVVEAPAPKPPSAEPTPRFTLTIKNTETDSRNMSRNRGRFQVKGANLRSIISFLYNISKTKIIGPPLLDEARYEISSAMPEGERTEYDSILKTTIEATFKIRTKRATQEMEVYVLSVPDQNALRLKPNSSKIGHNSDDAGVLAASAVPLVVLADDIEDVLKLPVIDETGLKGNYDWTLLFDEKNPESIVDELRKELGLELRRARKQVEVLVITTEGSETKRN